MQLSGPSSINSPGETKTSAPMSIKKEGFRWDPVSRCCGLQMGLSGRTPDSRGPQQQQGLFPRKPGFFGPEAAMAKCSSPQPAALMDAALLSFPGDGSQHYSSFSRSNQSSRASSCCASYTQPCDPAQRNNLLLTPPPRLSHFWGVGGGGKRRTRPEGQDPHCVKEPIPRLRLPALNEGLFLEKQHETKPQVTT